MKIKPEGKLYSGTTGTNRSKEYKKDKHGWYGLTHKCMSVVM